MSLRNVSTQLLPQVTKNDSPLQPGYNGDGFYWSRYPAMISGISRYDNLSTETGSPVGTVAERAIAGTKRLGDYAPNGKVNGSPSTSTGYGGTAAY